MTWIITSADDFSRYREHWNRLNESGPNSGLLHTEFIEPLLWEFGDDTIKLALYGGETPQAMALLKSPRVGIWATFQPSQLPVGPWLNQSGLPLARLLKTLSTALPAPVLNLSVTQQDPDFYSRPDHQKHLQTLDYINTARVQINASFEDYWKQRGKNLRQNLKRQTNRLLREGIEPRLERLDSPQAMAGAVRDYGALESAGWKSHQGTAIHPDNPQGRFYTRMLERFCQRDMGRVYRLWYGDRIVATDLCIGHGTTLIVLKTTYDESITASSPAMLMRRAYFEEVFQENTVRIIEFYGQVMEWHTKLTDDIRTLYHINYYPWPMLNTLYRLLRGSRSSA